MKGINVIASAISLSLLASCGSVYTDSMNLLYNVPLPLFIKEKVAQAAAPRFDVAESEFEDPFLLTLTSDTPGADIYYTTDGSEPGQGTGILFSGSLPVSETVTIRAIAVKEGYAKSSVVDKIYEKCEYDVYVSGMISQLVNEEESATHACFWKNEEMHMLDTSNNVLSSEIHQLMFYNDELFAVGGYPDISNKFGYWLNSIFNELTGSSQIYESNSIFVNRNGIYIAGVAWDELCQMQRACYWLNGAMNFVGENAIYSSAKRILIYNDIIYILGAYLDESYTRHECYWVNNIQYNIGIENLTPNTKDLFVINDNIYVVGSQKNSNDISTACYWKNGIKYDVGDGIEDSNAEAILVTRENEVNIVGYQSYQGLAKACYWKNGETYFLECGLFADIQISTATAITQMNNNIYIAGFCYSDSKCNACYWKNGVRKDVYIADLPLVVTSIVVAKKQPY